MPNYPDDAIGELRDELARTRRALALVLPAVGTCSAGQCTGMVTNTANLGPITVDLCDACRRPESVDRDDAAESRELAALLDGLGLTPLRDRAE